MYPVRSQPCCRLEGLFHRPNIIKYAPVPIFDMDVIRGILSSSIGLYPGPIGKGLTSVKKILNPFPLTSAPLRVGESDGRRFDQKHGGGYNSSRGLIFVNIGTSQTYARVFAPRASIEPYVKKLAA